MFPITVKSPESCAIQLSPLSVPLPPANCKHTLGYLPRPVTSRKYACARSDPNCTAAAGNYWNQEKPAHPPPTQGTGFDSQTAAPVEDPACVSASRSRIRRNDSGSVRSKCGDRTATARILGRTPFPTCLC
ncbi:hypothetical protein SKAU_G00148460 [Synaphobranchus kaupii]|uniref:Uncharacterized protein n=1 Tax=Synaphobranchus kaupii TaxID=118154 RepID=A0A9Q1FUP3_SYNKA|nr:hypothetical protein SKAU_G00148460 [Synaphobranchus kaupii]